MATSTKIVVKPKEAIKPTPQQIAKANLFAKDFALRKGLISGENTHVGNTIPRFVDSMGMPATATSSFPANMITDIRKVPSYVTDKSFVRGKDGLDYFEDQNGDFIPVHPDILRSSRFNPNRGLSADVLIAKK